MRLSFVQWRAWRARWENRLERLGQPLALLLARLYVADVFFASGKLKLDNFLNDDWASTVFLFAEVHPLPGVSPHLAAALGTCAELAFASLLALGLFGRLAALGLLAMTGVIELAFQLHDPHYVTAQDHLVWALLSFILLTVGPGRWSLDALLRRRARKA